jgi:hypothetical protein
MMLGFLLLQADPGGFTISLPSPDWPTLIPTLVGYFFDALGTYLQDLLRQTFNGAWGSSANVLGRTDPGLVWDFGPVRDQVGSVQAAARAVLLFGVVLFGLRSIVAGIVPMGSIGADFFGHLVGAVVLLAAFPIVVPEVIGLVNQAAQTVGTADLGGYLSDNLGPNPLVAAVLFLILIFFVARLVIKAVWRILFLAITLPIGPFAMAAYAVPGLRWITGWWARMWGGMLVAQIPSIFALSLGLQLFARNGGLFGFFGSIAAVQMATDIYDIMAFGSATRSHGAPFMWALPFVGRTFGGGGGSQPAPQPIANVTHYAQLYGYE